MTRQFNIYKAELDESEQQQIDQNNELRLMRERAFESGRIEEIRASYDEHVLGIYDDEDEDEVQEVSVEEFARTASKAELIEQLEALEPPVESIDKKASRDKLADQLVAEVKSRQQA